MLAIFIGWPEGNTLALELAGKVRPRPMAPDLTARLVEAAGALIERVSVSSLRENTFYATVTLTAGGESHEIDARPSDALNLAARVSAPIFVDAQVMDDWAVPSRAEVVSQLTACGGPNQEAQGKPKAPSGLAITSSVDRNRPAKAGVAVQPRLVPVVEEVDESAT